MRKPVPLSVIPLSTRRPLASPPPADLAAEGFTHATDNIPEGCRLDLAQPVIEFLARAVHERCLAAAVRRAEPLSCLPDNVRPLFRSK